MATFTKENEGKTFIIGQRLSWRQSKARASNIDSYREVELTFIKITDKCVVYEVTLNGITHKVKSMIKMGTLPSAVGTHRYIKFTKKAVWGIFHGTIAYEVGFIEKEEHEEEDEQDEEDEEDYERDYWVASSGCLTLITSTKSKIEEMGWDEWGEIVGDVCDERKKEDNTVEFYWVEKDMLEEDSLVYVNRLFSAFKKECSGKDLNTLKIVIKCDFASGTSESKQTEDIGDAFRMILTLRDLEDRLRYQLWEDAEEEDEFPEDEHFCGTCSIPLVEDDFFTLTEEFGGRCESCREDEEKIGIHVSILEENCGNCGKKELLRFCDGCQFGNVGIGGFCSNCRISNSDNDTDKCLDCSANELLK